MKKNKMLIIWTMLILLFCVMISLNVVSAAVHLHNYVGLSCMTNGTCSCGAIALAPGYHDFAGAEKYGRVLPTCVYERLLLSGL